jgi:Holliday junction resolvase RusA-like endonuclease
MRELHFFVPGEPVGKAARVRTKNGHTFLPTRTRDYMAVVSHEAHLAMAGSPLFDGPVGYCITMMVQAPKKRSKELQVALDLDRAWAPKKPDCTNVLKGVEDAMNRIVWRDDAQVVRGSFAKKYSETPGLHIYVEAL